jgi:Electron transfer flavoprotein-ubiquinone oxidoreductase, 4Fe-4S
MEQDPVDYSYKVIGAPESRFCPAKVYEYIVDEDKKETKL